MTIIATADRVWCYVVFAGYMTIYICNCIVTSPGGGRRRSAVDCSMVILCSSVNIFKLCVNAD